MCALAELGTCALMMRVLSSLHFLVTKRLPEPEADQALEHWRVLHECAAYNQFER